jgi:hypothetical protein
VGQQGYRFCAQTQRTGDAASQELPFEGRQAELSALQTALAEAQRGTLQLVLVTGDPGIGKTTLVRQFLSQVAASTPLGIGGGRMWLVHLPALVEPGELEGLQRQVQVRRCTA